MKVSASSLISSWESGTSTRRFMFSAVIWRTVSIIFLKGLSVTLARNSPASAPPATTVTGSRRKRMSFRRYMAAR